MDLQRKGPSFLLQSPEIGDRGESGRNQAYLSERTAHVTMELTVGRSRRSRKEGVGEDMPPTFRLVYAAVRSTISWSTTGEPMPDATSYPVPAEKPTGVPTS